MSETQQTNPPEACTIPSRAANIYIGRWNTTDTGETTFTTLVELPPQSSQKTINDALRELGPGTYDVMSARTVTRTLEVRQSTVIR